MLLRIKNTKHQCTKGFTGDFAKKYWELSKNSVVWLGACSTASSIAKKTFIELIWEKINTCFGWSDEVITWDEYGTLLKFFTYAVGTNKKKALNYGDAHDNLKKDKRPSGYSYAESHLDSGKISYLMAVQNAATTTKDGALVPILDSLSVDSTNMKMTLRGKGFSPSGSSGATQTKFRISGKDTVLPKVTLGGQELNVTSATETEIVCDLSGDLLGYAQVEVDERKSNELLLNGYRGTLHVTNVRTIQTPNNGSATGTVTERVDLPFTMRCASAGEDKKKNYDWEVGDTCTASASGQFNYKKSLAGELRDLTATISPASGTQSTTYYYKSSIGSADQNENNTIGLSFNIQTDSGAYWVWVDGSGENRQNVPIFIKGGSYSGTIDSNGAFPASSQTSSWSNDWYEAMPFVMYYPPYTSIVQTVSIDPTPPIITPEEFRRGKATINKMNRH